MTPEVIPTLLAAGAAGISAWMVRVRRRFPGAILIAACLSFLAFMLLLVAALGLGGLARF